MPLRLLFPLAYPLPPLLRLLPTPASARFYSPSRLATSFITPTSRRPINRHRLLSRTYIPNQASHTKPTIEEIKKLDEDELLGWIQEKLPKLLKDDDLKKLQGERVDGVVFLNHAGDKKYFHEECNLASGTSERLADLAWEITGGENASIKKDAFQSGIRYEPPDPLVSTTGIKWVYQPPPDLYEILATNVLDHYAHYKRNEIDKTYIPTYFFLGGAGTGKSRHASEFASSVQEAIKLRTQDHELRTQDHELRTQDHELRTQYHELTQRLKNPFVFHVSFENGTPLMEEEMSNLWNAIGARMLHQLLRRPIEDINKRFVADPRTVFRLVAAAQNVDLYDDFTGILVVDGIQKAFTGPDDGMNKKSAVYRLLGQIGGLGLMSQSASEAKGRRKAPFITACVTGTCFGPVQEFLADTHRKRVYLPLNRLDAPKWKKDNSLVLNNSLINRLLVNDVGGHARAIELIADLLAEYRKKNIQPNIVDFANGVYVKLMDRYGEAISMLHRHALTVVQCALSRQQIHLGDTIPGSNLRWEQITATGLIWFERTGTDYYYNAPGYLVVPYIWLWMLARLEPSKNTERLCQFLQNWQFNDYAELLYLETGKGSPGNTLWQSFEVFYRSFRILRSLGFEDGQEVPLKILHSGCKLRDDQETMVVNRYLEPAQAVHRVETNSIAEKVDTRHNGTLDADAQLSHATVNAPGAPAGDFFFKIKTSAKRSPSGKDSQGNIVHEVGQCKLIQTKLTQDKYNAERKKSARPDDIFMLYTKTKISDDFALPDRSGLVDASCWDSYFGPFAGRAYMASQYNRIQKVKAH